MDDAFPPHQNEPGKQKETGNETRDGQITPHVREMQVREMMSGLANDFNNLLVGIIGNARFLLDERFVKPAGVGLINEIIRCAERCTRLTTKMHSADEPGHAAEEASYNSEGSLQLLSPIGSKHEKESYDGPPDTVLVIDDEEVVRNVSAALIERSGYKVISTGSGKEGVEIFEHNHNRIICVLLDLTMPYIRGNVVFARLKAIDPGVRVFLMSGYSDRQAMREFESEKIEGFIPKPFDGEDLINAVKSVSGSGRYKMAG